MSIDINVDIEMDVEEQLDKLRQFISKAKEYKHSAVVYKSDYAIYVNYDTTYDQAPPKKPIEDWVFYKWGRLSQGLKEEALTENIEPGSEQHKENVVGMILGSFEKGKTIQGVFFIEDTLVHYATDIDEYIKQYGDDPEQLIETLLDEMEEYSKEILFEKDKVATGELTSDVEQIIDNTQPIIE